MISRLNKILQGLRDALLLASSVLIMASSYGKWVKEPAHYVLFGIAVLLFTLTSINVIFLIRRAEGKRYFYFNTILQFVLSIILAGLPIVSPIGLILLLLNTGILITLRRGDRVS
jgi:uncharacterized membrane protein SirB2